MQIIVLDGNKGGRALHKRQEFMQEDLGIHPQRCFVRKRMEGDGGKGEQVFVDDEADIGRTTFYPIAKRTPSIGAVGYYRMGGDESRFIL